MFMSPDNILAKQKKKKYAKHSGIAGEARAAMKHAVMRCGFPSDADQLGLTVRFWPMTIDTATLVPFVETQIKALQLKAESIHSTRWVNLSLLTSV